MEEPSNVANFSYLHPNNWCPHMDPTVSIVKPIKPITKKFSFLCFRHPILKESKLDGRMPNIIQK